jgi:acetyl-CoA synthetase
MARTVFGNHDRYISTYLKDYPGYFFAGDGAHRSV